MKEKDICNQNEQSLHGIYEVSYDYDEDENGETYECVIVDGEKYIDMDYAVNQINAKVEKLQDIKNLFVDLKDLLNEHTTNKTFRQDLQGICNGLHDLKERIYSEKNEDTYEEDNISLGWALDLIDYLYKIYKVVEKGE